MLVENFEITCKGVPTQIKVIKQLRPNHKKVIFNDFRTVRI